MLGGAAVLGMGEEETMGEHLLVRLLSLQPGLTGGFLLVLKGAEQLPQLVVPVIDAAWRKRIGMLAGMALVVDLVAEVWAWGAGWGLCSPYQEGGRKGLQEVCSPGWPTVCLRTASTPWPLSRSLTHLQLSFLIRNPGRLLSGVDVRLTKSKMKHSLQLTLIQVLNVGSYVMPSRE